MTFDPLTCDCYICEMERNQPDPAREEARMVGCTCSMRFTWTPEHDSDCDLWFVDEFWAGFVCWSPDEEALIRTAKYPEGHDDPFSIAYGSDLSEEYEWQSDDTLSRPTADKDIDIIANKFMASVLGGGVASPPTGSGAWEKREDGLWYPCDDDAAYKTALEKMTTPRLPGSSNLSGQSYTGNMDWDDDWYWQNTHSHYESEIIFPDGTKVQASSIGQNGKLRTNGEPDFGLYLAQTWRNEGIGIMLPWQDWGLPEVQLELAAEAIKTAFNYAKAGMLVEVGCIGAHGRTGTVLSCMGILAGLDRTNVVAWLRKNYCTNAVEGREQEWFVRWFAAYINGEEMPARLPKPVAKVVTSGPKAAAQPPSLTPSQTASPPAGGPTTKTKRKTRRGNRGGRRVQRSRQAARR